jgi:hypothetical protein
MCVVDVFLRSQLTISAHSIAPRRFGNVAVVDDFLSPQLLESRLPEALLF